MNRHQRNQHRRAARKRFRDGATLTELLVACVVLSGIFAVALPMTMKIARQRLVNREILVAQHELMNQMERLSVLPAAELSADEPAKSLLDIHPLHQQILHDAELSVEQSDGPDAMRRVQLSLTWTNRLGNRMHPQTLTTWFSPVEEK